MKVYRNIKEINRRDQLGRRLSMAGLVILFIGLLASFAPTMYPPGTTPAGAWGVFMQRNWGIISFAALPLGFICASLGSYFITRYARRRWPGSATPGRPDEAFERTLKGLDDRFALFVFSLPVGYVLVTPAQIITFAMRSDKGRVRIAGDKWREGWGMQRVLTLFAREGVGHPPTELADQARKLQAHLVKAPANDKGLNLADAPIEGAVLFLNNETQVEGADTATVPVLRTGDVKEFVRRRVKEVKTPPALMRAVAEYLAGSSKAVASEAEAPAAKA